VGRNPFPPAVTGVAYFHKYVAITGALSEQVAKLMIPTTSKSALGEAMFLVLMMGAPASRTQASVKTPVDGLLMNPARQKFSEKLTLLVRLSC